MDLKTRERLKLREETRTQNIEIFAGKYDGKPEDWQHVKAIGAICTSDGNRKIKFKGKVDALALMQGKIYDVISKEKIHEDKWIYCRLNNKVRFICRLPF